MAFTGAANEFTPAVRNAQRYTLPDLALNIEQQTDGQVKTEDFYPVPCVVAISKLIEAYTQTPQIEFSTHPHCGIATLLVHRRRETDSNKPGSWTSIDSLS